MIKDLFKHNEFDSLRTKVKKGVVWTGAISLWTRLLGFVSAAIITRILSPDDFGLLAISMSVIAIAASLTSTGFSSAIIQKQNDSEKLLNTAWTMELVRGLILFSLLFFFAPLISSFYEDERLLLILRVLSISFLFTSFQNIGVVLFRKNLDIRKEFLFGAVPDFLYLISIIVLTFWLRNVWALVIATVLVSFYRTIMSFIIHPHKPKIDFNFQNIIELFSFGKWILFEGIIAVSRNQGISLFVGKVFNISNLGNYNRAETFSQTIFFELSQTLWKVGYPTYSKLSNDKVKFKKFFLLGLKTITLIGFPMAFGLFFVSPMLVTNILTEKWAAIIPLMQLFSINAILGFIQTPIGISFQALGKPSIGSKLSMWNFIIFILLLYPIILNMDLSGVIIASIIANLIVFPIGWIKISRILNIGFLEFLSVIIPQLIISFIMLICLFVFDKYFYSMNSFFDLILAIISGISIYLVTILISEKLRLTTFKDLVKNYTG